MVLNWLVQPLGTIVWAVFFTFTWFSETFVQPVVQWWLDSVLAEWEEGLKSIIRQFHDLLIRTLNWLGNRLTTAFNRYALYFYRTPICKSI